MEETGNYGKMPVLIVEDNPDIIALFRGVVEDLGLQVEVFAAQTAKEAVKLSQECGGFKCVFMDANLNPEMKSVDTLPLIRQLFKINPDTYMIAHSSSYESNKILLAVGCHEVIRKEYSVLYSDSVDQAISHLMASKPAARQMALA